MPWKFLQTTDESVVYIALGGFVVVYNMISLVIKRQLCTNEVVFGTTLGILIGPHVLEIFDPRSWTDVTDILTREFTRVVLVIGLFAIGVELPPRYMKEHAKSLLILVVPTMAFGWLVAAAFIHILFPKLNFVSSLVISACLTPTDPIISAAVIGGDWAMKNVADSIRHILLAESAANDGLAYPFLSISIYLTTESSRAVAFEKWVVIGWIYQVILGTVIGAVIGIISSKLLKLGERKGYLDRQSFIAQYFGLALFTAGVANSLGNDDLLAAFAAGCAISWDGYFKEQTERDSFGALLDLVFNCACFIYIGAWIPFDKFHLPELDITPWKLVVLMLVILALRRIPSLLILYKLTDEVEDWKQALFCGHFGPIGVGCTFICNLAQTQLQKPRNPPETQQDLLATALQPVLSFVILGSIIFHGLSIPVYVITRRELIKAGLLAANQSEQIESTPSDVAAQNQGAKDGENDHVRQIHGNGSIFRAEP